MAVGLLSLLGLGQVELAGNGGVDVTEILKVVGSVSVGGIDEGRGGGWVEAVVGEEGCLVSGRVDVAVISKLSDGQPGSPIIVLGGDVGAKDLLNGAVGDFGLAVSLGVVGGGDVELGAEGFEEGGPEIGGDAGVTVRDYNLGETFLGEDMVGENVGELLGGDGLV